MMHSRIERNFTPGGHRNLTPGWTTIKVVADPDERIALAHRFGLVALEGLEANLCLWPMANTMIRVRGNLQARVVQICVVTLELISVLMAEAFILTYGLSVIQSIIDPWWRKSTLP